MKTITLAQFQDACRAQGVPRVHVAAKCPICGTIQSMADLIAAGAGASEEEVEKYMGFSCVGRFKGADGHQRGMPPGNGCDWTLGGLFSLHKLEVVTPDGKRHPTFEMATPEEAKAHMRGEPQKFTPLRIQLSRAKGWKMPPNTVKVDRTTKWGNVFVPGKLAPAGPTKGQIVRDRRHAFVLYRSMAPHNETLVAAAQAELRGKNLACWCDPMLNPHEDECHGAVLLEIANA